MSAPNAGRQSPEPERQTGAQQQDPQAQPDQGATPSDDKSNKSSEDQLKGLSSNPTHILAQASEEKTSKK